MIAVVHNSREDVLPTHIANIAGKINHLSLHCETCPELKGFSMRPYTFSRFKRTRGYNVTAKQAPVSEKLKNLPAL
jgi:hypothetical protein